MRGFEKLEDYNVVELPRRGTSKSAGYDIRAVGFHKIFPNETKVIRTGITAYMKDDEFLDIRIRSGLAFRHFLTLQNDAGVIDADFYGKHIQLLVRNEGKKAFEVLHGDRIAQGIFSKYLLTDDDKPVKIDRSGGFGSTGVE